MKATTVEELIYALESFDTDEEIIMGLKNGKGYIYVGRLMVPIQIVTSYIE